MVWQVMQHRVTAGITFYHLVGPRWDVLRLSGIEPFPGVQWKLRNIAKISPTKHIEVLKKLESLRDII